MTPIIPQNHLMLLAVVVLGLTGLVSIYTTRTLKGLWRVAILCCRVLAVAGVLALMLNIGTARERFEAKLSSWAIMLDRSASMAYQDDPPQNRWDTARSLVEELYRLSEHKDRIHLFAFSDTSTRIQPDDLNAIQPDGTDTRIVDSGRALLMQEKTKGAEMTGVVLISDGHEPVSQSTTPFALLAAAHRSPVYPIVIGKVVPSKDMELSVPQKRLVSFPKQPVRINGFLVNHRMGPVTAEILLRDTHGTLVEKSTVLVQDGQKIPFDFEVVGDEPGYCEFTIETALRDGESNRANNNVNVGIFVLTDQLNVLMLEGEPYWDTKFLSHLLRAQTNISMTAIFRVAKDRFFKVSTDSDMTSSEMDVFPDSEKELSSYDLVVLGRGTEYFIDENRAALLKKFVQHHGGCLFFARGKSYEGSQSWLSELEPVTWEKSVTSNFKLVPLLAGEQAGLFGGLLPGREDSLWNNLPILTRANACGQLKSFTTVLARGIPEASIESPFPLLVSKRYGNGLVLMINGDGLWKWGFSSDAAKDGHLYQDLWINLFQWAVSYSEFHPGSDYLIRTDNTRFRINDPFRVQVRTRAHAIRQDMVVGVYRDEAKIQTLILGEDTSQDGGWSGLLTLSVPGVYRLVTESTDGKSLGAQTSVRILPPPGETDNFSTNAPFLEEIANTSGGNLVRPEDLPELVRQLDGPETFTRKGDMTWETWWDSLWILAGIVFLFCMEWYMRRRQGLH
jgi:hypothetical protein